MDAAKLQSRKYTKPQSRKNLVMLAGAMSVGLMSAHSARAGYWKVQSMTTGDGSKTTLSSQDQFNPGDYGYNFPEAGYPWYGLVSSGTGRLGAGSSDYSANTSKTGATIEHKNSGSGTATFEWEAMEYGRPDGSTPPDWLYVEVKIDGRAVASSYTPSFSGSGSPSADSVNVVFRIGDATTAPVKWLSTDGQTRNAEASATTHRLLRFASEGESTIDVPLGELSLTATASSASSSGSGAHVSTIFGYEVKPGYRGIAISNSRIEDSFYKGVGPSATPGRIKHEHKADGSIVTDSAVDWYESSNESFKGWLGGGPFEAPAVGMSNPTYHWDVVGGEYHRYHSPSAPPLSASTPTYDLTPSPPTSIDTWYGILAGNQEDGSDLISSSVVKVKATDPSDGAVAENTFTVNWHLPAEWESSPYQSSTPFWNTIQPTNVIADNADPTGSVSAEFQYENFYMGALGEAAPTVLKAGSYFAASGSLGIAQKLLLTMIGLAFEQASPNIETKNCTFEAAWTMGTSPDTSLSNFADYPTFPDNDDDGVNDPHPTLPDGSPDNRLEIKSRYRLTDIRHCVEYTNDLYRGDGFDQHGYSGEVKTALQNLTGRAITVGNFVNGDTTTNTPPPAGG